MKEDDIKLVLWVRFLRHFRGETFPQWGVSIAPFALMDTWNYTYSSLKLHWDFEIIYIMFIF